MPTRARPAAPRRTPKPAAPRRRPPADGDPPAKRSAPPALTAAEARRLDLNATELGVPVPRLMAQAGKALAAAVLAAMARKPAAAPAAHGAPAKATGKGARAAPGVPVVLFCGKGNNGGDGLAAAALLQRSGRQALVVLAEPESKLRGAAQAFLQETDPKRRWVWPADAGAGDGHAKGTTAPAWRVAPIVVDCLLGTGLQGAPRPPYADVLRHIAQRKADGAHVIACDLPSGLGSKLAVVPHETVTFHAPKVGMTRANSGTITVADNGIPAEATTHIGLGDLQAGYVIPAPDSHKGSNGIVLAIGGSVPLAGAIHYAAFSAYRCGADLVHALVPGDSAATLRAWGPHVIVHEGNPGPHLDDRAGKALRTLLPKCSALLVGPGLGQHPDALQFAATALDAAAKRKGLPVVVDADGLDALQANPALYAKLRRRLVVTPHAREFQDLTGRPATAANAQAFATSKGCVVLLKGVLPEGKAASKAPRPGHEDLVAGPQRSLRSRRGHPTMTVGGTGDVLAGATAELLAKGAPGFEAACAATYLTGCAGELAATWRSYGALATDVAEAIPAVLLRLA